MIIDWCWIDSFLPNCQEHSVKSVYIFMWFVISLYLKLADLKVDVPISTSPQVSTRTSIDFTSKKTTVSHYHPEKSDTSQIIFKGGVRWTSWRWFCDKLLIECVFKSYEIGYFLFLSSYISYTYIALKTCYFHNSLYSSTFQYTNNSGWNELFISLSTFRSKNKKKLLYHALYCIFSGVCDQVM